MKNFIGRAPSSKKVQSYPITLLDGTSSMNFEYDEILKAHKKNFDDLNDQQLKIQFTEDVHDFEPFMAAGSGDITKAFKYVLNKLLSEQFPQHIVIIFISDGDEKFVLDELEDLIKKIKERNYQIQFVSISIGKWFPNTISNQLRAKLHNTEFIEPIYHHDKNPERTEEEMFNFFDITFQTIRSQSLVYQDILETDKEVKLTLISNPQNTLPAGALFVSEEQVCINGQPIETSNDIRDKKEILVKSAQQALILFASDVDEKALENFQTIKDFSDEVVNEAKQNNQNQGQTEQEQKLDIQFNNVVRIVNQFADGDVDIDQCTPNTLTDLQAKLADPNASASIQLISQQISISDNGKELEPDNINAIQKKKLKNVGCYARAQAKRKQIQQLEQTYESAQITMAKEIIINGLKKYKSLFTQNQKQQDVREILIEYYKSTLIELDSVFERVQLANVDEESYDLLKELNLMMKEIDSVRHIKKALPPMEANKILDNVLVHAGIGIQQSMAIPEINDEFDFLPESLKSQIRPENDDRENFVVAIFDNNDSMKNEIDSAIKNFNQEFPQKTIKLFWQNTKFSLFDSQQQYTSLVDIFNEFEQKNYALKTKKICICLITDGLNDYAKLHKQLKNLKPNRYLIKLSYVTIGSSFHFQITNELDRMMQSRNLKGRPLVLNVPRQKTVGNLKGQISQLTNSTTALNIDSHFAKRFQDLRNHLFPQVQVEKHQWNNKSQIY
ncbi:unnamed protein product (macronuclear) [Paramecium tetraurelia]|uniref:VWFA domain-containing protein n=1 Tax=Paramecium tetraurelia TaxID=5888 RepID=A0BVL7_PARTE|nr:uncharacterized protein GSPATT00005830001 [Paramecium tetraurelia]CAK62584.1 unnamed protein product [Paramecium tetraurelia]|eukprot:XP_001429982.1 hypothetical protein (macronuclear) [Paramecium tetraurelia strain d4-2]